MVSPLPSRLSHLAGLAKPGITRRDAQPGEGDISSIIQSAIPQQILRGSWSDRCAVPSTPSQEVISGPFLRGNLAAVPAIIHPSMSEFSGALEPRGALGAGPFRLSSGSVPGNPRGDPLDNPWGSVILEASALGETKPTCAPRRMLHAAGSDCQAARRVEVRSWLVRNGSGDLWSPRGVGPTGGVNIEN
jgi:hypothetical protein